MIIDDNRSRGSKAFSLASSLFCTPFHHYPYHAYGACFVRGLDACSAWRCGLALEGETKRRRRRKSYREPNTALSDQTSGYLLQIALGILRILVRTSFMECYALVTSSDALVSNSFLLLLVRHLLLVAWHLFGVLCSDPRESQHPRLRL